MLENSVTYFQAANSREACMVASVSNSKKKCIQKLPGYIFDEQSGYEATLREYYSNNTFFFASTTRSKPYTKSSSALDYMNIV